MYNTYQTYVTLVAENESPIHIPSNSYFFSPSNYTGMVVYQMFIDAQVYSSIHKLPPLPPHPHPTPPLGGLGLGGWWGELGKQPGGPSQSA